MDLFKLLGTIAIDNADALKALDDTSSAARGTAEDIDDMASSGSGSGGKFAAAMGKVGNAALSVGKWVGTGMLAAGTAMGGLTIKAMNLGGELEQNMGGSEQVFGKHAGKMQETAKNAFSNMGLSTSDFLGTANKMGALFQGAGFSIAESSDLSASAMQRAADVASIMGLDTSAAMEAIAGAAKGNFTMMDNLGVAMNDTTIQAYALSKGIDKSTQDMTNQEKIGLAMQMFMGKTAYAAGNYARENETLAGSLGTAKAALANFLDGSGDVESLVTAFSNAADVIIRNVQEIAPRLISGISEIVGKVIPMLPPLIQSLLPVVIDGAVSLINSLTSALPAILDVLVNSALPQALNGIVTIFNSLVSALPGLVGSITSALPSLIPLLVTGLVSMIVTLCSNFSAIIQPIISNLPLIIESVTSALLSNLPILINGLLQLVLGVVSAIPQIIQTLVDATPMIIEMLIVGILSCLPQLLLGIGQLILGIVKALPTLLFSPVEVTINTFKGLWEGIKNVFAPVIEWFSNLWGKLKANPALTDLCITIENIWKAVKNVVSTVINAIKDVVSTVWNAIKNNISTVLNAIKNVFSTVWNSIKNVVSTVINSVKNVISTVWNAIKTIIANVMNIIFSVIKGDWTSVKQSITNIINAIKSVISSVWNAIKAVISSVMSGIKSTISSIWNGIKSVVSSVVNGIKSTISSVFNGIKSVAKSTWEGIKTAITKPIESARDKIKGIVDKIKGFFTGMKLQFPNIKLPHFGITPSGWKIGDLLKGSIPKLSIDWYAKGGIMTRPTMFDYNPATGTASIGGEAGAEAIAPIDTLLGYVRAAVAAENGLLAQRLDRLIELLAQFFPDFLEALQTPMVLDPDGAAVAMAPAIDKQLGIIAIKKGRGR